MHESLVGLRRVSEGLKETEADLQDLTQDGGSTLHSEPKVYCDTLLKVQRLVAHIHGVR